MKNKNQIPDHVSGIKGIEFRSEIVMSEEQPSKH
jgi:hypothetical protein